MFPKFFIHKAKKFLCFFRIKKGEKEKKETDGKVQSEVLVINKNGRDEPSRDVSAI